MLLVVTVLVVVAACVVYNVVVVWNVDPSPLVTDTVTVVVSTSVVQVLIGSGVTVHERIVVAVLVSVVCEEHAVPGGGSGGHFLATATTAVSRMLNVCRQAFMVTFDSCKCKAMCARTKLAQLQRLIRSFSNTLQNPDWP